jgi:hypothetical protein
VGGGARKLEQLANLLRRGALNTGLARERGDPLIPGHSGSLTANIRGSCAIQPFEAAVARFGTG